MLPRCDPCEGNCHRRCSLYFFGSDRGAMRGWGGSPSTEGPCGGGSIICRSNSAMRCWARFFPWRTASMVAINFLAGSSPEAGLNPRLCHCTTPCLSSRNWVGMASIWNTSSVSSCSGRAMVTFTPRSSSTFFTSSSLTEGSSMLTARMTTSFWFWKCLRTFSSSGIDCLHGPHHVAQKSSNTTLPRRDSAVYFVPSSPRRASFSIRLPSTAGGPGPTNCRTCFHSLGNGRARSSGASGPLSWAWW